PLEPASVPEVLAEGPGEAGDRYLKGRRAEEDDPFRDVLEAVASLDPPAEPEDREVDRLREQLAQKETTITRLRAEILRLKEQYLDM
ncbi:hypothetical protein ACFL59_14160, partial [Planctomycetota bacterium]